MTDFSQDFLLIREAAKDMLWKAAAIQHDVDQILNKEKPMAIIFDLDSTLVEAFKVDPLPGRVERIAALRSQGVQIAICTNQAGPISRYATGQEKYPTPAKIAEHIKVICGALELQDVHWFVSIGDLRVRDMIGTNNYQAALKRIADDLIEGPDCILNADLIHVSGLANWRKPYAGMLLAAAIQLDVELSECLYVGDMESDRQAAEAANCDFMWTHEFFDEEK